MEISKKSLSSAFFTWRAACNTKTIQLPATVGEPYIHTHHLHARYRSAISLISLNYRRQRKAAINDAFKRLVYYSTAFTKRNKQQEEHNRFVGYITKSASALQIESNSKTSQDQFWPEKPTNQPKAIKSQKAFQFGTTSQNTKENICPIDGQISSYERTETEPSQSDRVLQDSQRINLLHLGNRPSARVDQKPVTSSKLEARADQSYYTVHQKSASFNGPKSMESDRKNSSSNLRESGIIMGTGHINPRVDAAVKTEEITERRSRILSEKTKQFLQNFDMDQYMEKVKRKTRKSDGLNKSEIMLHENYESAEYDKINNSVNLGLNFNNTHMFK